LIYSKEKSKKPKVVAEKGGVALIFITVLVVKLYRSRKK
jgi:hypothetical protein